ncbi:flagellar biosynthesis protein FlhF [Kaarinaea lacus]
MKIKRFFSRDMRSAIRMVREELGPDAVILSNDKVNGGVEIVAAVDYDETLFEPPAVQNTAAADTQNKVTQDTVPQNTTSQNTAPQNIVAESALPQNSVNNGSHPGRDNPLDRVLADLPPPTQSPPQQKNVSADIDTLAQEWSPDDAELYNDFSNFGDDFEYDEDADRLPKLNKKDLRNRIEQAFRPLGNSKQSPYLSYHSQDRSSQEKAYLDNSLRSDEFLHLDDTLPEQPKINDTLYDIDKINRSATELLSNKSIDEKDSYSVWSQEPTLMAMRNEITNLRGMLEQQLAGFAWGDLQNKNPIRAKLIKQLLELGFATDLVDTIASQVEPSEDYRQVWQEALTLVSEQLPVKDDDLALSGGVVALVGATGVGKTTTIAKLAARYALQHGRNNMALITTDSYRIGALEQLRTYGRILGIPAKIAHSKKQLVEMLKALSDKKFILIDTAGMGQRDIRLMEQFSIISDCAKDLKTLLLLSTTTHRAALDEAVRTFSNVEINGCILTKLDETTSLGGALSVVTKHKLPVTYISDGQRVPEDLHLARAHTLLNRCVTIARRANQPLDKDSLELAFSRMPSHARA